MTGGFMLGASGAPGKGAAAKRDRNIVFHPHPVSPPSRGRVTTSTVPFSPLPLRRRVSVGGASVAMLGLACLLASCGAPPKPGSVAAGIEAASQQAGLVETQRGDDYRDGNGVPQNYGEAARWYRLAIEHGSTAAMTNLANLLLEGEGVAQDPAAAVALYRRAAAAGNSYAMTSLGDLYRTGKGVARDDAEAVRWYESAIDRDHNSVALNDLALCYEQGTGVAVNTDRALRLYNEAAAAGNSTAMANLGNLYATGRGVPQDDAVAVAWYRKAAELGNPAGERGLGYMYLEGRGVPKDVAQARRWLELVAQPQTIPARGRAGSE